MWLGNKALRTGVSASLCMLAAQLLNLKYPFFATLPSVMPISNNFRETIKSGGNRMIGSAIGAAVGILLALIRPSNFLVTGIGIIIIIYLCRFVNWESSASIAGLIFISIMVGVKGETAFVYSLHRLLDTFIGIAITTVVNNAAFSINIYPVSIKTAKVIYDDLLMSVQDSICFNAETSTSSLQEKVRSLHDLIAVYEEQISFTGKKNNRLKQLQLLYENFRNTSEELDMINSLEKHCIPNSKNSKKIIKLFKCEKNYENCMEDDLNIVFNYHLGRLLKGIDTIQDTMKDEAFRL